MKGPDLGKSPADLYGGETAIAILVYSVASRASFEGMKKLWDAYQAVREPASPLFSRPVIVAACKINLPRDEWEVTEKEVEQFAEGIGAMFCQTSAKDYWNRSAFGHRWWSGPWRVA
jgi:GTPase SAR1 family protein